MHDRGNATERQCALQVTICDPTPQQNCGELCICQVLLKQEGAANDFPSACAAVLVQYAYKEDPWFFTTQANQRLAFTADMPGLLEEPSSSEKSHPIPAASQNLPKGVVLDKDGKP